MDERPVDRVGIRIRAARLASGLTQKEVAQRLDISKQQIWKYEHGESQLTVERLAQIARLLGVRPSLFLGNSHRISGTASSEEESSDGYAEILEVYGKLSRSNRHLFLSIGRFLSEVTRARGTVAGVEARQTRNRHRPNLFSI